MSRDFVEKARATVNQAMSTADGGNAKVQFTVHEMNSLLFAMVDQERDLLKAERDLGTAQSIVESLTDQIGDLQDQIEDMELNQEFNAISEFVPSEDGMYEVYVGDELNGGRMFAFYRADTGQFTEFPDNDEGDAKVITNVSFWREILPEPTWNFEEEPVEKVEEEE